MIKTFFLLLLLFPALMLTSCERDGGDYQYKYYGYIVTGEQGNAEPLKGIHVCIYNSYEEICYAEAVTSDAGLFLLKVERNNISYIDEEDWFYDVSLIVVDKNNNYYSTSSRIAYPSLKPGNCGVIFLQLRNK